jgi:hypothetical protein
VAQTQQQHTKGTPSGLWQQTGGVLPPEGRLKDSNCAAADYCSFLLLCSGEGDHSSIRNQESLFLGASAYKLSAAAVPPH